MGERDSRRGSGGADWPTVDPRCKGHGLRPLQARPDAVAGCGRDALDVWIGADRDWGAGAIRAAGLGTAARGAQRGAGGIAAHAVLSGAIDTRALVGRGARLAVRLRRDTRAVGITVVGSVAVRLQRAARTTMAGGGVAVVGEARDGSAAYALGVVAIAGPRHRDFFVRVRAADWIAPRCGAVGQGGARAVWLSGVCLHAAFA